MATRYERAADGTAERNGHFGTQRMMPGDLGIESDDQFLQFDEVLRVVLEQAKKSGRHLSGVLDMSGVVAVVSTKS